MNKKAFTLIELIGVITIMGLLLLVVFPSTMKLINQNSKKKYNYYYDLVEKAAMVYATSREDELGGVYGSGCVEVELNTLINEKYVKKFEDDEVTCNTPDLTTDPTSKYVKVKITNNKGKIETQISMMCYKGTKEVYANTIKKTDQCIVYTPDTPNVLVTTLKTNLNPTVTDDNNEYFITGSDPNNYVWYSGKLWRVVSLNMSAKTMKLVTDDVISVITYNKDTIDYPTSNIYSWLNSHFIKTLRDSDNYVINTNWNYQTLGTIAKPTSTTTVNASKVGMLNVYEYNKIQGYLNKGQSYWLLSPKDTSNVWYVSNGNVTASNSMANFFGVRPSITLKSNISFITGGTGTKANPYRLTGDVNVSTNAPLNTRYSGEYVYFAGATTKYRIVSTDGASTKIIAEEPVGNSMFDGTYYEYSQATILGDYLNTTWYNSLATNYKEMIYSGDFCGEILSSSQSQSPECRNSNEIRNMKVGIPKAGDYFSNPKASASAYWTLNRQNDSNISCITNAGTVSYLSFISSAAVRPVVYIDGSVKITGGKGIEGDPFVISK